MATLTLTTKERIERLPHQLHAEFPEVPLALLEHDIEERARELLRSAHFDDFVPLLVRKTVRDRLHDSA